jgi:hypothetical protein
MSDDPPASALPLLAAKSRWVPAAAQKEEADALRDLFLRGEAVQRVDETSGQSSVVLNDESPANLRLLRRVREAQTRADVELVAMLRAGKLIAWGRVGSPLAALERLPADAWHTLRLTDMESGEARGGGIVVFGLRVAEPPAEAVPTAPRGARADLAEAARAWMHDNYLPDPSRWKHADAVTDCMAATDCTREQARAALSELPATARRRRGRPQSAATARK